MPGYQSISHAKFRIHYHLVFSTKFRSGALVEIEDELGQMVLAISNNKYPVVECGVGKAMKYLQDNTPHNQRTLFRLSEVPQGHTVESFVQSLDVGDVTRTVRASSSTMIGKKAISKLLGDKDRKIVYRYNTTRGVSIAHDALAEIVDEGEVIIPKDSEFVVAGTHYDDKSGNWIVDLADNH